MIRRWDLGSLGMSSSIGRLETSVANHQSTVRDIPEERKFHLRLDVSLKSRIIKLLFCIHQITIHTNSRLAYRPTGYTADVCCWTRRSFSCLGWTKLHHNSCYYIFIILFPCVTNWVTNSFSTTNALICLLCNLILFCCYMFRRSRHLRGDKNWCKVPEDSYYAPTCSSKLILYYTIYRIVHLSVLVGFVMWLV